jgi:hypothetical protein
VWWFRQLRRPYLCRVTLSYQGPQVPQGSINHRKTMGRPELLEVGHRRRDRQGSTTRLGTTDRMEQRTDKARIIPLQADDTVTRPLGSGPTRQSDARDSEPSFTAAAGALSG